jgi:ABC-2 type transport system ATP-binding protein
MLELQGVTRTFGDRRAVDDVTFSVAPGRLTGFVGANGAGKTTTMRIVLGLLEADAGTVTYQGRRVDLAIRRRFGYMPEERGLYPKTPVLEQLVYLARLYGVAASDAEQRARDLLERLGLAERRDDHLEALSLGNQQRVQIAAALLHDPEVLVLDEPFSGLDPIAVRAMADLLAERAAAGAAVLFSSHQLELVDQLCDDLVVLSNGRVVAVGEPEELRRRHARPRFRLRLGDDAGWLRDEPDLEVLDVDGTRAVVELPDFDLDQKLLARALEHGAVHEFTPVLPSLGEVFQEVSV